MSCNGLPNKPDEPIQKPDVMISQNTPVKRATAPRFQAIMRYLISAAPLAGASLLSGAEMRIIRRHYSPE